MVLKPTRRCRAEDDRGVVLVVVALSLVALLTIAALVVDLGFARQTARFQQGAMDAASLAGVRELPAAPAADPVNDPIKAVAARTKAAEFAWKSLFEGTPPTVPAPTCSGARCTYEGPPYSVVVETPYVLAGSTIASRHLIYTRACRPSPTFLAQVFGGSAPTVCRESVARAVQTQAAAGIGIIALGPTDCTITLNGTADVTVTGGAMLANSVGTPAICAQGTGCGTLRVDAVLVAAVGTVQECLKDHTTGTVVSGSEPVPDPYAGLPDSPCDSPAALVCAGVPSKPVTIGVCGTAMVPGRFASTCSIGGNNTVNLTPGIYWFDAGFSPGNGQLRCPTCSALTGGVLLYFYNGSLSHNGNLRMNFLPYQAAQPGGDLYGGISIYQRRGNGSTMTLGGTTDQALGSIYAKGAAIEMRGTPNRVVDGIIVADRYRWVGTSQNTVNPPPAGPKTDPIVDIGLEL